MNDIAKRLADLGITIPTPAKPVANYTGWVTSGHQIFVSGQLPLVDGKLTKTGRLGVDVSLEEGIAQARLAAINVLAQLNQAVDGDLSRIVRVLKITGFVACTPDFTDHPKVINGASDLIGAVLGEAGIHARAAVGVASLPLNAAVEVEAIAQFG